MLFSQENHKNTVMTNIKNEILNWIGNKTVTTDELHDFIKSQLSDTYEIGDAGVIINEMVAEELLIANNFEVKNNRIIIKTKGLINQKEFISSYNKMLGKVRDYLNKYCMPKYSIQYELLKKIDEKYEEIDSKSNKKIHYTYSHK